MGLGSRRRPLGTPITPGRRRAENGQNAPEGFLSPYRAIMPFQSDPPQSVMDFLSHREICTYRRPDSDQHSFHVMDWVVRRNTYGRYPTPTPHYLRFLKVP
jgi:hypothetical protein